MLTNLCLIKIVKESFGNCFETIKFSRNKKIMKKNERFFENKYFYTY